MSDKVLSLVLNKRHLPCDSEMYDAFIKEGVKKSTAIAFSNLFAFVKGIGEIDFEVRSKMEDIGFLTPENEIRMDNIEDSLEWILITQIYEGKLERIFDDKEGCYKFKNTEKGNKEAVKLIRRLSKNV